MDHLHSKIFARSISLVGTLMMLSSGLTAEASTIADWSFSNAETCAISTNNNSFGDDFPSNESNIIFKISKSKNTPNMPVEVMVQFVTNNNKSTGAIASVAGASNIALADLDGNKSFYWGVPKNLSHFLQQLKSSRKELKIKAVGGRRSEDIRLSTSGFKDVLAMMENECNGGASLVNTNFESTFLANVPDSIDPTGLNPTKATELRSVYYAAYKAAFNVSNASVDLAKLLAKYQPYIDELAQNRAELNRIQDVELPNTRSTLADARKQQVDASAEIASIDSQIPKLNAKIQASQLAYDAARAVIAPIEPEYNRITGALNSAQSTLSEAQNRLAYIETRLRDGAQQISNLEYEASSIQNRLPQKRSELERARALFRDAQSRRANFNVSWERDSRLRNHFEYSRLQSDRQNMHNLLRQSEVDLQRVRAERDRIARDLQHCRAQPIIAEAASKKSLVPGPGADDAEGGLVPGPPGSGNPGEPGNPPPSPPRDCSHLERALSNANLMVSQRESEQRNISNRINDISHRLGQIERQIDMEVRRMYDSLVYAEDNARRDHDRIEADVNNDQNRLSQIRSSDIPRLEREQSALHSEKPTVISRINDSTAAVSRLTQELTSFKTANDWDRKAAAVARTGNQLSVDQAALKQAQNNKATAQQRLEAGAVTEAQAIAKIESLNARVIILNDRANALDAILAKLPEERAQFDATLAEQKAAFESRTQQFLTILRS